MLYHDYTWMVSMQPFSMSGLGVGRAVSLWGRVRGADNRRAASGEWFEEAVSLPMFLPGLLWWLDRHDRHGRGFCGGPVARFPRERTHASERLRINVKTRIPPWTE